MTDAPTTRAKRAFVLACFVLVFGYGVSVGAYRLFPYSILKFGIDSVQQVWNERQMVLGTRPVDWLEVARYDGNGVTIRREGAAPGLTLIASFFDDANELRLISLDGTIVRRWRAPFFEFFSSTDHIAPERLVPAREWNTNIHGSLALPDGSVVFSYNYNGMVKLDRCGAVQWVLPRMTHHSIGLADDGGFWVPGRRLVETGGDLPLFDPPYEEDVILKISSEGEVLRELSVPKLLYAGLLPVWLANGQFYVREFPGLELVHLNEIEELPAELAPAFPQFRSGDLLLSLRQLNLLLVVGAESGAIKWHQTGPWIRQHDPDFLPDGTISVFNNNADDTDDGSILGGSSILRIDPVTRSVSVVYGGKPEQRMYSLLRGNHQMLDNGNVLVTEDAGGRVFEIDEHGRIVWEFVNRYDDGYVARVSQAIRYPEDYFAVEYWACNGDPEALSEDMR